MNSLPHVQRTWASTYSGWISGFISNQSLASRASGPHGRAGRGKRVVRTVVVVDPSAGIDGHRRRAGTHACRADEALGARGVGREPVDRPDPGRRPRVATGRELDLEGSGGRRATVADQRRVAGLVRLAGP